jgi:hypothetical protein
MVINLNNNRLVLFINLLFKTKKKGRKLRRYKTENDTRAKDLTFDYLTFLSLGIIRENDTSGLDVNLHFFSFFWWCSV